MKRKVVLGFDCHKDRHAMCALDARTLEIVFEREYKADTAGYTQVVKDVYSCAKEAVAAVEGTSDYGAGLSAYLMAHNIEVYEALRPGRTKRRRGQNKNDREDARRAAREYLAGEVKNLAKTRDGMVEEMRCILNAREQFVRTETRLINQIPRSHHKHG